MSEFVVDKGLDLLLAQINAAAPGRSKASDGSIGDLAHSLRTSDHNPQDTADSSDGDDPDNQVDARDFTHDPAHNADMAVVGESLRRSKDQRIKYVIWHDRIFYSTARNGYAAWEWQPHTGTYHYHLHVSVNDVHNDETQPLWQIGIDMAFLDTRDAETGRTGGQMIKDIWWALFRSSGPSRPAESLAGELDADAARDAAAVSKLDELLSRPPVQPAPMDGDVLRSIVAEAAEAAVRKVLGGVDGATPPAQS